MSDRIEKQILLKAPRARVWRAISDRSEFNSWFRVNLPPGRFTPGEEVSGNITYPGYEHMVMTVWVETVEPERRLSFRWHPYPVEPAEYSSEPTTLVTFTLEDAEGGTLLRLVESGFDRVAAERREEAYRQNEGGWQEQMSNIERHVTAN